MTYYINPIWFYLMNLSDGMKTYLCAFGIVVFSVSAFVFISWSLNVTLTDLDDSEKKIFKLFKTIIIASFITFIMMPCKYRQKVRNK